MALLRVKLGKHWVPSACRIPSALVVPARCRSLACQQVADMVAQRAELGKNFGVVLVPEGLVEFMHDVSALIAGGRGRGAGIRVTGYSESKLSVVVGPQAGARGRKEVHASVHASTWFS